MPEPLAYLNGRFLPAAQAAVPVYDAGFVLGATVSEQLRTFGGRLFRLDEHLARLERSLTIVGVGCGLTRSALADAAQELVARNHPLLADGDDLGLAIFVTPGPYATLAPASLAPGQAGPTVGLHTYPLPFHRWAEKYQRGEALVVSDVQQVPSACWPRELKCRSRMHYYLADLRASQQQPGARALLCDQDGKVTETATANVVACLAGEGLVSVPRESILPGISLAMAGELAGRLGLALVERPLAADDLLRADEVLLTSTPWCLLPVATVNGRRIGDGRPGPIFARLIGAWSEDTGVDIAAQARKFAHR